MRRLLLFLMIMVPLALMAQQPQPVTVKGKVTVHNKYNQKDINERVEYSLLTKKEAQEAYAAFERLTGDKNPTNMNFNLDEEAQIKVLKKRYGFVAKNTTKASGRFEINAATTLCLLFITGLESKISEIVEIVPGKTEYDVVINVQRLTGVEAVGKQGERESIGGGTGDPDDGNEYFTIRMNVPQGYGHENARMIIQTFAVNCQTDDTLAYCQPLVYEGAKYHELQNKRMDYDYFQNDSLHDGYQASTPLVSGEWIRIDTTIVYKKTDKNASFRGPFKYVIEDYHHVYKTGGWGGTCLRNRPFKFLDFSPALADMELTEEFKEEAQSQFGEEKRDLMLSFEVGKSELKEDSMNNVNLNKLVAELRSYGDKLIAPRIQGMASPDGNMRKNQELAQQRAQKAAALIQRYLPSHLRVSSSNGVYTWNDVIERLEKKGKTAEAEQVRAITSRTETPDRELRTLEFYETEIVPILESMRVMKASYQYIRARVLSAEEAVEEYYTNKPLYQKGEKHFSNGDYWNIFNNLTDSAEIDTLTMIAYRHITKDPEYATENIIAPYVCNRVALMNLKNGTPNARILEPFIDLSKRGINAHKAIDDLLTITVNRREILLNQAVTYYQELKMDSAKYFINWLKRNNASDPALESLERIMNLKSLHYNNYRSAQQEQEYEAAKNYVLNISDENKAILYSEIPEWGKTTEAMQYVDLLPDEMPKKWYLKGVLWARQSPGNEPNRDNLEETDEEKNDKIDIGGGFYLLTEEEELHLSDAEFMTYDLQRNKYKETHGGVLPKLEKKVKPHNSDDDIDITGIPYYLAYFQHAFELEPQYKRMYFNEGHVPEDLRKQFKYKKKDIPAYQKLFRLLKTYDERKQQQMIDSVKGDVGENKSQETDEQKKNTDTTTL